MATRSKTRSTTTVTKPYVRDIPVSCERASTRATSPARAGRTLLNSCPTFRAQKVGTIGGRSWGEKR